MKFIIGNVLLSLLIVLGSCNSTKEAAPHKEDSKQIEFNLIKEGYTLGIIVYNKDIECSYVIIDNKSGFKYDPININDARFETFKVDKKEVYFKFRLLRRMNRCENIQPIELVDIKEK